MPGDACLSDSGGEFLQSGSKLCSDLHKNMFHSGATPADCGCILMCVNIRIYIYIYIGINDKYLLSKNTTTMNTQKILQS